MKHYRIIGFAVASALSIGGFALLTSAETVEVNRDFKIQTISGDPSALNDIGLEATIKTGQSKFEKVLVTNDKVDFKETAYDTYRYVGEDVLENKEVYRKLQYPAVFENEDYLMAAAITSGFPYATDKPIVHLNIKDMKTGEVSKYESLVDVTVSEYVNYEGLYEHNGTYYYAMISQEMRGNQTKLLVYTVNPKTGEFNKQQEMKSNYMGSPAMVNGKLVVAVYDDKDGDKLAVLDLVSQTVEEVKLSDQETLDYFGSFYSSADELFIESDNSLYPFDLEKLEVLTGVGNQPADFADGDKYGSIEDFLVQGNKVYIMYSVYVDTGTPYQLLQVADKVTGDVLFEGKITHRADQGIIEGFKLVEVK